MQRRTIVKMVAVTLVLGGSLLLGMGALFAPDKASAEEGQRSQGHY